jgi:DNA topoisomerase IA
VVTSAVGHLVEIKAPEEYDVKRGKWSFAHLPVVPPHFDVAPIDKAKTRLTRWSSWSSARTWAPSSTPATRGARAS